MNLEIAMRLIELRKAHGLSQEALADKLGVTRQAVSKWERVEAAPDTDNLIALANLYGVSLDELLSINATKRTESADEDYTAKDADTTAESDADADTDTTDEDDATYSYTDEDGLHIESDDSTVHIGPRGIHVKDGTDEVHIGWKGIHIQENKGAGKRVVKDADGRTVFVAPDGKTVVHVPTGHGRVIINGKEVKRDNAVSGIVDSVSALLCLTAYLLMGFLADLWHPGWLVFFLVPVLPAMFSLKRLHGVIPIIVTGLFLLMGLVWNLWHPGWVIFLAIPIYYTLVDNIKKLKRSRTK